MKWICIVMLCLTGQTCIAQEYYFRLMSTDYGSDIQKITTIFQSRDQMIWLGTDKGLYSFDGRVYRYTPRPDRLFHQVTSIAQNSSGEIFAGYDDGFIQTLFDRGDNHLMYSDSFLNIPITRILFASDETAFICTYGAGIWKWSQKTMRRLTHGALSEIDDIYDATIDHKGRLWVGTDEGIWIYDETTEATLQNISQNEGLPDNIVVRLEAHNNGDVWIGLYDHGICRYITADDTVITVMPLQPEEGDLINLVKGYANEIWFATERIISHFRSDHSITQIKLPIELDERIEDLLFDNAGNLWLATGNQLYMANTHLEHRIPGIDGIQAITSLRDKLWIGTDKGLFSLDKKSNLVTRHLKNENLNILSFYHDENDLLWIGTFGQGLYIYDPVSFKIKHLTETDGISNNSILNIDGSNEKVWLATLGGITEIAVHDHPINEKPRITLFQEKYNFPAGYVYDVYVDVEGKVWFGTDGKGLFYFYEGQMHSFSPDENSKDSFDLRTIYSITGDNHSNIWVSGINGNIYRLDERHNIFSYTSPAYGSLNSLITSGSEEILMIREEAIEIHNPVSGISHFGPATGLISFSPEINSTARDEDGSIWIGDTDKIIHYTPLPSDTALQVEMHMIGITTGQKLPGYIRLGPDSNFLDLRFTGLWYPDPASVTYRYMLEGHDKDWIHTQEGRAVYSKLSPGNYIFKVAGTHNDDFTKSLPLTIEILVLPPFYRTWWFITSIILLISLLAYLYFRARIHRINRLHQLEKEKTTLQLHAIQAQVNPHFMFNSFNTLSGIIEEDQAAAVDYVDQLSGFFRGVLMHREAELISLEEEIDIMRHYTYILKKRHRENLQVIESIHNWEGNIAPLSLQLLLENAIKHNKVSKTEPLTITITVSHDWVVVSNPIQPKIQVMTESTGFGLSSLLTRYQYLTPSKIEIINDGNTFTVKIPIIHLNP